MPAVLICSLLVYHTVCSYFVLKQTKSQLFMRSFTQRESCSQVVNKREMAISDAREILKELKRELYDSVEANDITSHLFGRNVITYYGLGNCQKRSEPPGNSF